MPYRPPTGGERVYIRELCGIVNREADTIRKWERDGLLPKRLRSHRDDRNLRYWTRAQVEGIQAWMKRNDLRPGKLLTSPDKEAEHIEALRTPKFLNGHHIRSAKQMAEKGKTLDQIINRIFPKTRYTKPVSLEKALRKIAERDGWELPKRERPPTGMKAHMIALGKDYTGKTKRFGTGSPRNHRAYKKMIEKGQRGPKAKKKSTRITSK